MAARSGCSLGLLGRGPQGGHALRQGDHLEPRLTVLQRPRELHHCGHVSLRRRAVEGAVEDERRMRAETSEQLEAAHVHVARAKLRAKDKRGAMMCLKRKKMYTRVDRYLEWIRDTLIEENECICGQEQEEKDRKREGSLPTDAVEGLDRPSHVLAGLSSTCSRESVRLRAAVASAADDSSPQASLGLRDSSDLLSRSIAASRASCSAAASRGASRRSAVTDTFRCCDWMVSFHLARPHEWCACLRA